MFLSLQNSKVNLVNRPSDNLAKVFRFLEQPFLVRLKKQGALPWTFCELNMPWFQDFKFDTVLDIGANTGQFSKTISALLPDAKVIAFEPLPDCFYELQEFIKNKPNIQAFNVGLGDEPAKLSFERSDYTASSSFLKMTDIHKDSFPFTAASKVVEVNVSKLDDICKSLELGNSIFVKVDVQGYEDKVLKGGQKTIRMAKVVIIETSFVPLYENQPLFEDIYSIMKKWGFSYQGALEQLRCPTTGRLLQSDAIFIKSEG